MKFAIIDIETTGMGIQGNRMTEIAIVRHDGSKKLDQYHSLVNPECAIPMTISRLTGITNAMVADAPKFYEIAKDIIEFTEDCVFVAHNVNFDYNVVHKEFSDLGYQYRRKKLCTIRLARKLIPGLPSYSLGKLCNSLSIPISDRHRAQGDTDATVILFEKLWHLDESNVVFNSFLKVNSREATLPPALPKEAFDRIPDKPGVYYFHDVKGSIIYVGKAINLKKRVLSHFYDKKNKEVAMCQQTADISFELTGDELIALLFESAEIKKHYPLYNRAQRRKNEGFALFKYEDRAGIKHLAWNKLSMVPQPLMKFFNVTECRLFMEKLCDDYDLCPKFCHLQNNSGSCFHYQLKKCKGICRQQESISSYNQRVDKAIASLKDPDESIIIQQKGRSSDESGFVLIEEGIYRGFGFYPNDASIEHIEDLQTYIEPQKENRDVQRLIRGYLNKHENKVVTVNSMNPINRH